MNTKMIFIRSSYMRYYSGETEIYGSGGGSYVQSGNIPHERFNFYRREDGYVFGFWRVNGDKLSLERIGNLDNPDRIDNVLIIFTARHPKINKLVIVGWYENATIYRTEQHYIADDSLQVANWFKCKNDDAHLLKEEYRTFDATDILPDGFRFGMADTWYADDKKYEELKNRVINYIDLMKKDEYLEKTQLKPEYRGNNLWFIRYDNHSEPQYCYDNSLIAIGWGELGDIRKYKSKEEFIDTCINKYKCNYIIPNMIWRYYKDVKPGDIVLFKVSGSDLIKLGTVLTGYSYNNDNNYPHIHFVKWLNTYNRTKLSKKLKDYISCQLTFFDITRHKPFIAQELGLNLEYIEEQFMESSRLYNKTVKLLNTANKYTDIKDDSIQIMGNVLNNQIKIN